MRERRSFVIFFLGLTFISQCSAQIESSCSNDGYYTGNSCVCTPFFTSSSKCQNRVCQNDGSPRSASSDQGCFCPLGYISQNCEAVRCTQESPSTFEDPTEKVLAALIPYNLDFKKKITTSRDDPIDAMCTAFLTYPSSYNTLQLYLPSPVIITRTKSLDLAGCKQKFQNYVDNFCVDEDENEQEIPIDCDKSNNLTTYDVSQILVKLPARSRFYIFSNLLPVGDEVSFNLAVRRAISKRIVINSIFYEQSGTLMSPGDYNKDSGYQFFRNLAEGTLGNFITPYSGVDNRLLGDTNVEKSVEFLEQISNSNYGPVDAHLETDKIIPTVVNVGSDDFYIIFRLLGDQSNQTVSFISKPDSLELLMTTGFWYVYRARNLLTTGNVTSFVMSPTASAQFTYYVHANVRLETFTSVTTSPDIDATSPFAITGSTRTLVANIKSVNTALTTAVNVKTAMFMGGTTFTQRISPRKSCTFSLALGDVNCDAVHIVSVVVRDEKSVSSVTPFMCAGPESDTAQIAVFEDESVLHLSVENIDEIEIEHPMIDDQSNILLPTANMSRTFALLIHNQKDIINNILIQPNNIIQYMVSYIKTYGEFKKYYYNLFSTDSLTNTKEFTNLDDFITSLMTDVQEEPKDDTSVDVLAVLNNVLGLYMKEDFSQFSDVFLFIKGNSMQNDLAFSSDIESSANYLRSRIYVVAYEDELFSLSQTDFDLYKHIVEKTGGAFIHTRDATDIQSKFFPFYFNNLIGSFTLDQRVQPAGVSIPVVNRDIFTNGENQDISIVIQTPKGTNGPVSVTLNDEILSVAAINQFWFATTTKTKTKDFNALKITVVPISADTSFAVYTQHNPIITTTAFTDSFGTSFSHGNLIYGSSSAQYPIVRSVAEKTVQMTVYDSSIQMINSGVLTYTRTESEYQYFWNYSFVCSNQNDIYYFKTVLLDGSSTLTQSIETFVCAKVSDCLNGGTFTGFSCLCRVGFVGENCEDRICQNNGTLNVNGLCTCVSGFSGDFCEINPNKCLQPINNPDIRSSMETIIFVASPGVTSDISSIDYSQLNGRQLIVASCVSKQPTVILTTTFGNDLQNAFKQIGSSTDVVDINCLMDSLIIAMNTQTSKRGMIFVFTNSGNWVIDQSILTSVQNLFSSGRYDMRIKTNQNDYSSNLKYLAVLGNGIPTSGGKIGDYILNYVFSMFEAPSITNTLTQTLTVVESSLLAKAPTSKTIKGDSTIPDNARNNLIIHTTTATLIVNIDGTTTTPSVMYEDSDSKISVFTIAPKNTVDIEITSTSADSTSSYSIEIRNAAKSAFGFQDRSDLWKIDENFLNLGPHASNNILNFYISNMFLGDSSLNMAYLEIIGVNINTSEDLFSTQLPVSRRTDSSCLYPYYSELTLGLPNFCHKNEVYKLRIISTDKKTNSGYQIQQTLSCFVPETNDDCYHGHLANGECNCLSNWYGTDCSYPQCSTKSKYSTKLTCDCSYDTSGLYCQQAYQGKGNGLSFIIDLTGYSDYLYNVQINSIRQLVTSFNLNEMRISLVGSDPSASSQNNVFNKTFTSTDDFLNRLSSFENSRTKTDLYQDISSALSAIQKGNDHSVESSNIFAITQRSYTINDMSAYNSLKASNKIMYYGVGTQYNTFSVVNDNTGDMIKTASDGLVHDMQTVDDIFKSMIAAVNVAPDAGYLPGDPLTPPSCINSLEANIFVQVDISQVDNYSKLRQTLSDFLGIIRNDFNTKPDTSTSCDANTTNYQWTNKAGISSVLVYDKYYYNPQIISFCATSDKTLRQKMLTTKSGTTPQWDTVMNIAESYYNLTCNCYRLNEKNVKHITIWIPMKDSTITVDDSRNSNYYHLIMPYNFDLQSESMFYKLAQGSLTKLGSPKANTNIKVEDLFIKKWTSEDTAETLRDNVYAKLKELFLTNC